MFLLKCSVLALLAVHLSASSASPSAQRPFGSSKGTNTPGVGFEEVDCSTWKLDVKPPLRCFFFETPLHYNNAADNRTARLAVLHYPAGAGKTPREQVQGSLFLNQGGPGVSGVQFLIESAEKYDKLVTNGAYDLIGWDPRGVGLTQPGARCFRTLDDEYYDLVSPQSFRGESDVGLSWALQSLTLRADVCSNASVAPELPFVGTKSTVRDLRLMYKAVGDEGFNYYGLSYGTVIGNTFASMFPDEVRRMVLDGVLDADDHYSGLWETSMEDNEAVYRVGFLGECAKVRERCQLYKALQDQQILDELSDGEVASRLEDLINSLLQRTRAKPPYSTGLETHPNGTTERLFPAQSVFYSRIKSLMFSSFYQPRTWKTMTEALAELVRGNVTGFLLKTTYRLGYEAYKERKLKRPLSTGAAFRAIASADALQKLIKYDVDTVESRLDKLQEIAPFGAEVWINNQMSIQTWRIENNDKFTGNFTVVPKFPILYVGNDYDPVTPLSVAKKHAKLREGSGLLRVKQYGHTSDPLISNCTSDTLRAYFLNGSVPLFGHNVDGDKDEVAGKVCTATVGPYDDQTQFEKMLRRPYSMFGSEHLGLI